MANGNNRLHDIYGTGTSYVRAHSRTFAPDPDPLSYGHLGITDKNSGPNGARFIERFHCILANTHSATVCMCDLNVTQSGCT